MGTNKSKYLWLGIGAGIFILYPHIFPLPFPRHVMIMIFLYATLGLAWNMIGGYAGQISLGHVIFFGTGAYTSTLLLMKLGVSPWVGMLAGGGLSVVISFIIGWPCFKLAGHYFAIATIAIAEIAQVVMLNWDWAGGAVGLTLPILPEAFINFEFHSSKLPYYYIALAIFLAALGVTYLVDRSKLGYYFKAIKGDLEAAKSVGVNVIKYKFIALAISAFFTSLCGSFYAQYVLFIDPDSVFVMSISIMACLIATLGGVGTVWGPAIGAFILIPISEFTRIHLGGGGKGTDLIIYGLLIMIISIYQPFGVIGIAKRFQKKGVAVMALLEVNQLVKDFGGLRANDYVDLRLEEGEIVGLIGPNGAGKTTLFNCIAGFYTPTSGQVIFKGEDITGLPANEICLRGIARTFQIVRVFKELPVLDNVLVGAFNRTNSTVKARAKALEVLDFCGLASKKNLLAGGLTIADKKRLEVAKALATGPSLLMLDEAMAGLNQTETAEAVALIKKIQKAGLTIILVEHVMEVVMPISKRVVVLEYGKKIAEDTPEKVIHNEEVIKAYLGDKYHATRRAH